MHFAQTMGTFHYQPHVYNRSANQYEYGLDANLLGCYKYFCIMLNIFHIYR